MKTIQQIISIVTFMIAVAGLAVAIHANKKAYDRANKHTSALRSEIRNTVTVENKKMTPVFLYIDADLCDFPEDHPKYPAQNMPDLTTLITKPTAVGKNALQNLRSVFKFCWVSHGFRAKILKLFRLHFCRVGRSHVRKFLQNSHAKVFV